MQFSASYFEGRAQLERARMSQRQDALKILQDGCLVPTDASLTKGPQKATEGGKGRSKKVI